MCEYIENIERPTKNFVLEKSVPQPYWSNWYFGWGWFLWFGIFLLMFSSLGNWGYTYRAHRKYGELPGKEALDILNERYARGDITREEWGRMKLEIASP